MSRLRQILRVLDKVSEAAEVVDAVFEALPCDVQKRAQKNARDKAGLLDNAGQYGIDGADWKLKAVYDNFHKVDPALAVANIIRNEIQDQIYGKLNSNKLASQAMAAMDKLKQNEASAEFEKAVEEKRDAKRNGPGPLNDLVNSMVNVASDRLGLVPPQEC